MKTQDEINLAREYVCRELRRDDLSKEQKFILSGLSVALQWVSGINVIVSPLLEKGTPCDPATKTTARRT